MNKDKTIVYMICNDKQIKMTRDVFDYLMTVKHYNKKLKEEIIKLQQEKETLISTLKLRNEISSYLKNKIDKAIKYIKSTNCYGMRSGKTLLQKYLYDLLNILNGSDEE